MTIWTIVGFVVGVLVTLWFRRDSRTFQQRYREEFLLLFGSDTTLSYVLEKRAITVKNAYAHLDNVRRGVLPNSGPILELITPSEHNWEVVQREVQKAHREFDYAVGLLYLNGHASLVSIPKI